MLVQLWRALGLYWRTELSWEACRRATSGRGMYTVVKRDGFLYVEPWDPRC